MANTISPDNLTVELSKLLQDYTTEVTEAIEEEIDKTAKLVLDEVKRSTAWTDRTKGAKGYRKGFRIKKIDYKGSITRIIYQKNKPGLAHLLELGHANRDGGRTSARPHMRPAYDKYVPTMEKNIEEIIKKGGK